MALKKYVFFPPQVSSTAATNLLMIEWVRNTNVILKICRHVSRMGLAMIFGLVSSFIRAIPSTREAGFVSEEMLEA